MRIRKPNSTMVKIFIMLLPIFQPKIFTQYNSIVMVYAIFNLLEFSVFLLHQFQGSLNTRGIHWPILGWVLLQSYSLIVMIINNQMDGIMQWGNLSLMIINFLFICEYALRKDICYLLKCISILGIIFLCINYFTLLLFPKGIIESNIYYKIDDAQFFLGIKTAFTTMMYPTIAASGALYFMKKNNHTRRIFFFAIMACMVNIFHKNISTAIVGSIIIAALFIVRKMTKVSWKFSWLFLGAVGTQILIVYLNVQKYFSAFIENVLHKDATLSSRVYIWDSAKQIISEQGIIDLLFGNGSYKLHRFVPYAGGMWQPHNQLLVWIYTVGLIGTTLICIFLIKLGKWNGEKNNIFYFLSIVSFTVIVLSVNEIYFDVAVCYVPYVLMYYIGKVYERRTE